MHLQAIKLYGCGLTKDNLQSIKEAMHARNFALELKLEADHLVSSLENSNSLFYRALVSLTSYDSHPF